KITDTVIRHPYTKRCETSGDRPLQDRRPIFFFKQKTAYEVCVTAVEDIIIDKDVTVVLKNYDITGYMLETNKLKLGEITSVCPFKSPFGNPYMRTLSHSKPV